MIRVLLVDDNDMFCQALVRLFAGEPDIEVVAQASSLAEAQEKLEGVDVAIIDRMLPDGDGLVLISQMWEVNPNAAVLVMSASVDRAYLQQALEAGAAEIVDKTATPEEFSSAIRRVAGG